MNESELPDLEQTDHHETVSPMKSMFEILQKEVNTPPDMQEVINVGAIKPNTVEYAHLTSRGYSAEQVQHGTLTRQQLVDAGYVFMNAVGGGEKPVIKAEIAGVDFGNRKLLTREELEVVRQHQQAQPDTFGTHGVPQAELTEDMYRFLLTADSDPRPSDMWSHANTLRIARANIERNARQLRNPLRKIAATLDSSIVEAHWDNRFTTEADQAKQEGEPFNNAAVEKKVMETEYADIFPWKERELFGLQKARGVGVRTIDSRFDVLTGDPSPFLESGFHFNGNPDVTIHTPDGAVHRLNMVNLVLATQGLNEMGDGGTKSHDQHYMTTGEYAQLIYPKTKEEKTQVTLEEERKLKAMTNFDPQATYQQIQTRMVTKAYEWATSESAPKSVKLKAQVAEQLKSLVR